jgi:hypothetical protein
VVGLGDWYLYEIAFGSMWESYTDIHLEIDYSVTYCSQTGMDLEIT